MLKQIVSTLIILFLFDSLRPSRQFFSYVGKGQTAPSECQNSVNHDQTAPSELKFLSFQHNLLHMGLDARKAYLRGFENNKGTDQPAHPRPNQRLCYSLIGKYHI